MSRIIFRYKLNENANPKEITLERHKMTTSWRDFSTKVNEFNPYVKTDQNPKGILDYEEYDERTKVVLNKPSEGKGPDRLDYERAELATYDRQELEAIAKTFIIDHRHQRSEHLVDLIMKEQAKRVELKEKEEVEKNETPDPVVNEIPKKAKTKSKKKEEVKTDTPEVKEEIIEKKVEDKKEDTEQTEG